MDIGAVVARVSQALGADPREIDRVCQDVAAVLVGAGVEPPVQVRSVDAADPWLLLGYRYWQCRVRAEPTVQVAAACARWVEAHVEPAHRAEIVQRWALDYAFLTRDTVDSAHDLAVAAGRIVRDGPGSALVAAFATAYHAGKLRSNLHFDELHQFLEPNGSVWAVAAGAHHDSEPLLDALRAFAAFGSRQITTEHATGLLAQAWTAPGRSRQVVEVCLDALVVAPPFPGQGELLRAHAAEAVTAFPEDHQVRFCLAVGLRRCGRFHEARASLDAASRLLPAGMIEATQSKLLREREIIEAGLRHASRAARHGDLHDHQRAGQALRRRAGDPAIVIRLLGLVAAFTVVIVVVTSQLTPVRSPSLRDRVEMEATLGGCAPAVHGDQSGGGLGRDTTASVRGLGPRQVLPCDPGEAGRTGARTFARTFTW
ncbi:tetratricopeptide repeat protein [Parafrankia discariae]|uniref:hypothetical protein n=1 Tax=Parafrankia discariae TaxID=365528 RepID=UPI000377849B|nr:hypothetical protein [Parafrankia discariae]